ncbi:MAG TPA: HDIG domain-containing protein [candidate division WOR-3 bacterium]|uniref:HDIG domain-containing protein n=1 Tax=candidate division WOR-3 bacterium TaxID=2052148 RepID=A0A9C9EMQ6_UNCW3|nr:HDIG domain-containing protein [candidate division WOR-3 bacterium]
MKLRIQNRHFLLIGIVLLLNIIFPPPRSVAPKYTFKEGEIAPVDVIAPYDFSIPKTDQELFEEKEEIAKRIPPVFELDNTVFKLIVGKLNGFKVLLDSLSPLIPELGEDSVSYLIQKEYAVDRTVIKYLLKKKRYNRLFNEIIKDLGGFYATGVIEEKNPEFRIITVRSGDKEMVESIDRLYSVSEVESLMTRGKKPEYRRLIAFLVRPNVLYNEDMTKKRIEEVFANVPKTKGKILKGEIIAEKHKRLTRESMEIISALESTYVSIGPWEIVKTIFFRNLFFFSLIYLLFCFGRIARYELFKNKSLYFITLLSAAYLIIGRIVHLTDMIYLLPVSFFIFLFALYFDFYFALIFSFIFAGLFGVTLNSMPIFVFLAVSGAFAAFSMQMVNSRLSLYRPMIYIALANIGAILFADVYLLKNGITLSHLGLGVLNSVISSFFLALLLPLFEKLFDFTTDLTLLELGNLNLPLFKEMAMEAPGTYHHSIVAGSLAEAGARAIGADPILARVGAYYHDIGKLKKPEYFIENQIGMKNPHDNLKPQMSALVIISHVKDGVEMAKKMKLPRKIINIIEQHHGTTSIEVFYQKALTQSANIEEDTFRYPGPKPKTKEAAVVMLADTVEAAARSEKNITVTKLQKILKESVDRKFNDGQLDECPINRHDLEQIKTAFLSILTGVFHPRVDYEKTNKKNHQVVKNKKSKK